LQRHKGLILVMDLSDRSLLRIHRGCIDETACSEGTTDGAVPVAAVAVTGAGTSANGTNTNLPRVLQIDSPGTAWVAASGSGDVVQILGSAAPLWLQLSYGVFATKPQ
jgi:hypothetical protein